MSNVYYSYDDYHLEGDSRLNNFDKWEAKQGKCLSLNEWKNVKWLTREEVKNYNFSQQIKWLLGEAYKNMPDRVTGRFFLDKQIMEGLFPLLYYFHTHTKEIHDKWNEKHSWAEKWGFPEDLKDLESAGKPREIYTKWTYPDDL